MASRKENSLGMDEFDFLVLDQENDNNGFSGEFKEGYSGFFLVGEN